MFLYFSRVGHQAGDTGRGKERNYSLKFSLTRAFQRNHAYDDYLQAVERSTMMELWYEATIIDTNAE